MYGIIHQPTGSVYVGSSCDVFRRWKGHVGWLGHEKHHCAALLDAWLLDGPTAFAFVILEQCPKEDLQQREQEWLDSFEQTLNTSKDTRCPMFDPAVAARQGAKMRGRTFTAEHRANISAAHRGLTYPGRRRRKSRPITQAQRAAISRTLMGHPVSEDTRRRQSAAAKARTPASRASAIAKQIGRPNPAVAASNRRRWAAGYRVVVRDPALWRQRLSAAHVGKTHGPMPTDTRQKISAAHRRRALTLTLNPREEER